MGGVNYGQPLLSLKDGGVGVYYSSFWGPAINNLAAATVLREHQIGSPQTTLLFVERPDARNFAGNDHFSVTRSTSNQLYGIGGSSAKAYHGGKFVYADGHVATVTDGVALAVYQAMSTKAGSEVGTQE